MFHIHSEDLLRLKEIAEGQAKGRPPINGGHFLTALDRIAYTHPQTLLELFRHIEEREPLTPGPYE